MTAIKTFLRLSGADRKLLFQTLFLLVKIRFMLWFMSFNDIQKSFSEIKISDKKDVTICQLSWALKVTSHYLRTTCLTNALTGYSLLSKYGYYGIIKIGVDKSSEGEFEAHAWLEYKDRVVIGESEKEYVPLFYFKDY